jgi:hypothetical protein
MKTRTFRSAALALIFIILLSMSASVTYANTNYLPSSWASQKIVISATAGIIPEDFDAQPFTESITRKDFCEVLINTCRIFGITLHELPVSHPFTDTTDNNAENAYMLGLTQGTDIGIFSPDLPLTREMAAVMLSKLRMLFQSSSNNGFENFNWNHGDWNHAGDLYDFGGDNYYHNARNHGASENHYSIVSTTSTGSLAYSLPMDEQQAARLLVEYSTDSNLVSGWAQNYMADVYALGILSGTGEDKLDPKSDITREQAVLLSLNVLAYCDESQIRAAGVAECVLPAPAGIFISPSYYMSDVYLRWNTIPLASAYDITVFKNGISSYTMRICSNYLDLQTSSSTYDQYSESFAVTNNANLLYSSVFGGDKKVIHAALKVVPVNSNGEPSVFFLKREFTIFPWANASEMITGDPEKSQFTNISQANLNMKSIKVKVWNLTASGTKKPASLTLTINKNVAENMKKIFEEIYNGKGKFPIKNAQGYSYRSGTSQHSNGTAVDINPTENYFISLDGVIKSGSIWKPGNNPYSILPEGDVVHAFNRYGWHWSPDMNWSNGKDYMHFSLNGK